MTEASLTIRDGIVVGMDYTLRLDNGQIFDSSIGRKPLEFLQGRGQIISGLERALYGMTIGDEKSVSVAPADGYGEADPNALQMVARDALPAGLKLRLGMRLNIRDSSGQVFVAYVASIGPDKVLLDFNHPLAGEELFFDVKIASLRPASAEELANGRANGKNGGQ